MPSRRALLTLLSGVVLAGCSGGLFRGCGIVVPPPPPPPVAGNPSIAEPGQYSPEGTITLQQAAARAYFVAANQVETAALGTYTLEAAGVAAAAGPEQPASARGLGAISLGGEWQILEEGKRVARRLPLPPRPWAVAHPMAIGAQRHFWVCVTPRCRWADGGQAQIAATLQAVGPRSLIYVDNRDLATIHVARAEGIRSVFDGEIWPPVTAVFGNPINPFNPAPGDGPTIILFSRTVHDLGWGGYFHAIHLFRDSDTQRWGFRSNEASMFFMSPNMHDGAIHGVNAHEFQHLINYSQKTFVHRAAASESAWIDEGLAQVAMDIAGHGHQTGNQQGFALEFFRTANRVSFHNWGHADAPLVAYYGGAWLFFRYIADRFGNAALTNLVQSPFVGVANIERVTGERIGRTLVYSGVAMVVSTQGLNVTDPRWTYRSLSLATIGRIAHGAAGPQTVRSLGFNFVAITSGGQPVIRATVTAGTARPYVGLVQ